MRLRSRKFASAPDRDEPCDPQNSHEQHQAQRIQCRDRDQRRRRSRRSRLGETPHVAADTARGNERYRARRSVEGNQPVRERVDAVEHVEVVEGDGRDSRAGRPRDHPEMGEGTRRGVDRVQVAVVPDGVERGEGRVERQAGDPGAMSADERRGARRTVDDVEVVLIGPVQRARQRIPRDAGKCARGRDAGRRECARGLVDVVEGRSALFRARQRLRGRGQRKQKQGDRGQRCLPVRFHAVSPRQ